MGLDITVYKITKEEQKYYFKLCNDDLEYVNSFPEWTKKLESTKSIEFYDWEKYKEQTGIDVEQYIFLGSECGPNGSFMELWPMSAGPVPRASDYKIGEDEYDWDSYDLLMNTYKIKINLDEVPILKKDCQVLYKEEVGYQRRGLNGKFYKDYDDEKIGYFVWTKAELERYKEDYCEEDMKEYFQKNIIDNFVEGECCVTFDW